MILQVFPSVELAKLLAFHQIVLFYEKYKYFVTLGYYLWSIQCTGRKEIFNNFSLLDYLLAAVKI